MASDPATTVVVRTTQEGAFTQRIEARSHVLTADEPEGVGDDAGPTPYELLLASLGACTSMTIRMYADKKGMALEDVSVRLSYDRVHSTDCEGCEDAPRRVHEIGIEIRLVGDLSEEEQERLLEIAGKCPVHRTLDEEKRITTRLG